MHLAQLLTETKMKLYIASLKAKGYSVNSILRKLSSVLCFVDWAYKGGRIDKKQFKQLSKLIANFRLEAGNKNVIKTKENKFGLFKSPAKFIRSIFKNSLSKRSAQQFLRPANLLGLFLLTALAVGSGIGIYNQFFAKADTKLAYSGSPIRAGRVLNFQGFLTDSGGTPITTDINMRFRLYDAATGGTTLYDTGTCSVGPDDDGIVNVLVGTNTVTGGSCWDGNEIPASVFTDNPNVYLGVTVGADDEMTDRQQIANVGYAINAEHLQGFPLGTASGSVPFINKDGDLLIAATAPGVRSINTSANFQLSSANAITIVSAGSGDITLNATESGAIKLQTNDTSGDQVQITNANLVADSLLYGYVGNDATGYNLLQLQSGSSAVDRFVVDAEGNTTIGGELYLGTIGLGDNTTADSGASLVGLYDDTMNYVTSNTTVQNAIKLLDTAIDTVSGSAGGWTDDGAVVRLKTIGDSVGIGTTAPLSKLGVLGNLSVGSTYGNIAAPTGGAIFEGNVGIGTTSPLAKLDIVGNIKLTGITSTGDGIYAQNGIDTNHRFSFTRQDNPITASLSISSYGGIGFTGGKTTTAETTNYHMYLSNTGNIGIGTTAPAYKLEVNGTLGLQSTIYAPNIGAGTDNSVIVLNTSGNLVTDEIDSRVWGSTLMDGSSLTANYLTKASDGDTIVNSAVFEVGGNVGIGTTVPSGTLHISASNPALTLQSTGATGDVGRIRFLQNNGVGIEQYYEGTNDQLIFTTNAGTDLLNISLYGDIAVGSSIDDLVRMVIKGNTSGTTEAALHTINSSNTSLFYVRNDGNIGIGTTAPAYKLDVNGSVRIAAASDLYLGTVGLGTTGGAALVGFDDTGLTNITATNVQDAIEDLDGAIVSSTYSYWTIRGDSGSDINVTNGYVVDYEGGEGIDTLLEANKLTISGEDATVSNKGIASFSDSYFSVSSGAVSIDDIYLLNTGDTSTSGSYSFSGGTYDFDNIRLDANSITATNDSGLALYDNASNGIFIQDGGNVGIGTTSPQSKLEVAGTLTLNTQSNIEALKLNDGNTKKLSLKWASDDIYLDINSSEPTNIASNGDFESNLTGWSSEEDWWDPDNESLSVWGAWKAIGAESYAASLVDLSGNGNNLTEGNPVTWSTDNGWKFYYTDTVPGYFTTTFVPDSDQSQTGIYYSVAGASGSTYREWGISETGAGNFGTGKYGSSDFWYNGGSYSLSVTHSVKAIAGNKTYGNGEYLSTVSSSYSSTPSLAAYVGACNTDGTATFGGRRYGKALVLYDTALSDEQVRKISQAMTVTVTRDTNTKYSGAASAKIVSLIGYNFAQSLNVGTTDTYTIVGYVYTDGSAVTSDDVEIYYNGSVQTTSYSYVGGGWYLISASVTGANEVRDYGIQVKAGKTVYLDDFSVQDGTASNTTFYVFNSGTGLVQSNFESTLTANTGSASEKGLVVKGVSSQIANLHEWQDYSGNAMSVVNASGYLGIGTSAPSAHLDVLGTAWLRGSSGNIGLFVNSPGNVGIGTTAPGYKLDVNGDIRIASGSDLYFNTTGLGTTGGAALVGFDDTGLTNITATDVQNAIADLDGAIVSSTYSYWTIRGDSGSDINVTNGYVVDYEGGEGIDTLLEANKLTISGEDATVSNKGIASFSDSYFSVSSGAVSIDDIYLLNTGDTSTSGSYSFSGGTYDFDNIRLDANSITATNDSGLALYDNASNGIFIQDGGNVGIGTTAPLTKLDVEGTASMSGTLAFRGTTDPKINILNGENFGIQTSVGGDTGLSEVLTILNIGNVGIGTTAPSEKLEVNGNIKASGATIGTLTGMIKGTSGVLSAITGTTNYATYWSDDNTIAAEQYLDMTRGGTDADLSGVATGGLIYKGASALAGTAALSGIIQGNGASAPTAITGTANYIPKWSATAPYLTATSSIYDDGNVGIGTTVPGAKLHINQTSTTENALIIDSSTQTASQSLFTINSYNFDYPNKDTVFEITGNGHVFAERFSSILSTTYYLQPAAGDYSLIAAGAGLFGNYTTRGNSGTMLAVNGNVGIGTNNPQVGLEITDGELRLSTTEMKLQFGDANNFIRRISANNNLNMASDTHLRFYIDNDNDISGAMFQVFGNVADTVTTSALFTVVDNGNVGIGVDAPSEKLEVNGNIKADSIIADVDLTIGSLTGMLKATSGTVDAVAGTNNYIPKWSSSALTTTSSIYDDGNVGIGTTVPSAKLEVDGIIALTSTAGNLIQHTAQSSYDKIRVWNSNLYTIGMVSAQSLGYLNDYAMTFTMNNNANRGWLWRDYDDTASDGAMSLTTDGRLYVKSTASFNGNVGIGTTAPDQLLHLYGASGLNGATPVTLNIQSQSAGAWTNESVATQILFSSSDGSGGAGTRGAIKSYVDDTTGADFGLSFWTTSNGLPGITEQMRIDHSGNVGIGTTTPTVKLDVVYDANKRVYLAPASSGSYIGLDTNSENFLNYYNSSFTSGSRNWRIGTRSSLSNTLVVDRLNDTVTAVTSTPFVIDNSGRVGIGTTSPATTLHVVGDTLLGAKTLTANEQNDVKLFTDATGTEAQAGLYYNKLRIYGGGGQTRDLQLWQEYGGQAHLGSSWTSNILYIDSSFSKFTVNSANSIFSGNVGIGTTAPTTPLSVVGGNVYVSSLGSGLRTSTYNIIRKYSAEYETGLTFGTRYPWVFETASTGAFEFINHLGTELFAIKGSDATAYFAGNVGIGTTAPGANLEIVDLTSSGAPVIQVRGNASSSWPGLHIEGVHNWGVFVNSAGNFWINDGNDSSPGASNAFIIKTNGYIGMGNTSPSYQLTMESSGGGYYNQSTNQWTNGSSVRWKENIHTIDNALEKILSLNGVYYNWKPSYGGAADLGFIAEEVGSVIPVAVDWDPDNPTYANGLSYGKLTAVLVEAMKEEHKNILELKENIDILSVDYLNISQDNFNNYQVKNINLDSIIDKVAAFADIFTARIKAGFIQTKELVVETTASIQGSLTVNSNITANYVDSSNIRLMTADIEGLKISTQEITAKVNQLNTDVGSVITKDIESGKYYMSAAGLTTMNLTVTDVANLEKVVVNNSAKLANISITGNTISTTLDELKLTALSQVTLFDGTVVIAKNGNITTEGKLLAKKGVETSQVTIEGNNSVPLAEKALSVNKSEQDGSTREVANISASGSAYFADGVTFDKHIASTSAIIAAEQTASQIGENTASILTNGEISGKAVLPAHATEILVRSDKIKNSSLIYTTPLSSTNNQILYVESKKAAEGGLEGWFKIKIDQAIDKDIEFSWWIL